MCLICSTKHQMISHRDCEINYYYYYLHIQIVNRMVQWSNAKTIKEMIKLFSFWFDCCLHIISIACFLVFKGEKMSYPFGIWNALNHHAWVVVRVSFRFMEISHIQFSQLNGDQICRFLEIEWFTKTNRMSNADRVSGSGGNIRKVVGKVIHFNSIKDLVINNGQYVRLMSYVLWTRVPFSI